MAKSNKRQTENRNLPRPAIELTAEEQQQVRGGATADNGTITTDLDKEGLAAVQLTIPDGKKPTPR